MRVALVHYHLQSGGVTRIICHVLKALSARGIKCMVLTGKAPSFEISGAYRVVPGLQYEMDRPQVQVQDLIEEMRKAATEALGGPPDLWHVHNHSLGKSLLLPLALRQMAESGEHFLFHIHDFAEDGRPANYAAMLSSMAGGKAGVLASQLYPQGDHIHYAVLNTRDHGFLSEAGVGASQLHLLPNPVDLGQPQTEQAPLPGKLPLWLYPTRAIRRKNLGEFLLLSALARNETWFATTSAPENPLEQPRYRRWKQVAVELGLPVQFELVGPNGYGFIDLLRLADVTITTSVAEGFGMAFLEPWTQGTPIWGRNLSEITRQFADDGLSLPGCYDRLTVPLDWLGAERVRKAVELGLARNLAAYGRTPAFDDVERCMRAWIIDDRLDFGRLDEAMQEDVLARVVLQRDEAEQVRPAGLPDSLILSQALLQNKEILHYQYTLERYGERLERIYEQVAGERATACDQLDGEILLDRFLAPERLHLLRVD